MTTRRDARRAGVQALAALALGTLLPRPSRAQAPATGRLTLADAMRRAEALREQALRDGDQAYGAVVWRDGVLLAESPSRVVVARDATAHAEMSALREARRRHPQGLGAGAVLVSTSRPCPMCEAAAGFAGIARLVHGPALAEAGAPSAERMAAQAAALVAAAEAGDLAAIDRLLAEGVPVDARDARRRTPLLAATHGDRLEAARRLIAAGADVNAKDELQDSPFLYAGAEGRLAILRLTLAAGADLASTNRYGGTALIPAAHHGHVAVVRELLERTTIARDHVNRLGWTALLEAIILGDGGPAHTEIVRLLLAHGARPDLPDAQGVTPLAHAEQRGQRAIAALLREALARRAPPPRGG